MKDLIRITHHGLPDSVTAGMVDISSKADSHLPGQYRQLERRSGRKLIETLVNTTLGPGSVAITGTENEKPTGKFGELPLHLSISHSKGRVAGVVSMKRNLGIDLEHSGRQVPSELTSRILHPEEGMLTDHLPILQLWTVKESALKWYGSGLRVSMKKVRIRKRDGDIFQVLIDGDEEATVCSFVCNSCWISIAFDP